MQRRVCARSPRRGPSRLLVLLALPLGAAFPAACGPSQPALQLVVLVTVDTLRADHLGFHGEDRGLSPGLDALAAESIVFDRAYAPAPFTLPSIGALLAGRPPDELGLRSNRAALPEEIPTLATVLSEVGWCTRAVVSNFVLRRNSGIARGFERYDDSLPEIEAVRKWPERVAGATTDAALAALDDLPAGRCLLWVHYQDPHGPYTPPEGERERFLTWERSRPDGARRLRVTSSGVGGIPAYQAIGKEREVAFYRAGYDAEIAYTDREVGRLVEGLRERGLMDRALLVFTADHGESLGEDDYWFAHGMRLSEALVRVPLWFRVPGRPAARRSDVAWLVDVLPTILARLGIAPPDPGSGRDLLAPAAEGEASVPYLSTLAAAPEPRHAIVEGDWKLIATLRDGASYARLVHVDRGEMAYGRDAAERIRAMADRLRTRRRALAARPAEMRQRLTEQDAERLRALGYLEAGEGDSGP